MIYPEIGLNCSPFHIFPKQPDMFVHHVYFWLKRPSSEEDLQALVDGLRTLSAVPQIKSFHIGKPADTNRPVIDASYSVSWLNIFDSAADEAVYQEHPMHLEFIAKCSHLWERVVVYDSEELS